MTEPRRRNRIGEQFAYRTIAMLESPAYAVLTLSARRILDRIEIEQAHHGGADNGRLPVTFDQFEAYAIHRHAIAPALRELEALGFIEITEHGRAGNAEWRRPTLFRLTWKQVGNAKPTDEWRRIRTEEDAKRIAADARERQKSSGGFCQISVRKPHRKRAFHSAETTTTAHSAETATTSRISGRVPPSPASLYSPVSSTPEHFFASSDHGRGASYCVNAVDDLDGAHSRGLSVIERKRDHA